MDQPLRATIRMKQGLAQRCSINVGSFVLSFVPSFIYSVIYSFMYSLVLSRGSGTLPPS